MRRRGNVLIWNNVSLDGLVATDAHCHRAGKDNGEERCDVN